MEDYDQWKQYKREFKSNYSQLEDLLDEFDQKKDLASRLPHTEAAQAKIAELENNKREMEAQYTIMDAGDQQKVRPKRQELNKKYEDARAKFLKCKAGTEAMQN